MTLVGVFIALGATLFIANLQAAVLDSIIVSVLYS
jgi:hypothetical protein